MIAFDFNIIIILLISLIFWLKSAAALGPCENFYEYACANYSKENSNPNYLEITQKLDYEINKKLIQQFERLLYLVNVPKQQTYRDKMIMYYKACRTETRRNVRKYFEEIKLGDNTKWPLLETTRPWLESKNNFNFWPLLGELQSYGLNNVVVNQEIIRNRDNTLSIWLSPALIPYQGSLPDHNIMQVLLMALGIQETQSIIQQLNNTDFKWLDIEELYANSYENEEITKENLFTIYPQLKIYLEYLLGSKELENISTVTLTNPQYFKFLQQKNWTHEELNYLMLKFLYFLAVDSTAEYTPLECVKDLRNKFDLSVNYISYNHFFKHYEKNIKKDLNIMLYKLKDIMIKYFKENRLKLSHKQIQYLENKLKTIKINIGNLPDNFDYKTIENFYQDVPNLQGHNYYKNHLLLLKHLFRKSLLNTQNQSHFIVTSKRIGSTSSPFYVPEQNMVVIPIGSFQMPFFHYYKQTRLEKLSIFGFVLVHELTHAFDTTGLLYDQEGFRLASQADIITNTNFLKSLNCMQQQLFTEEIDERIADFFGVRVAYRTYKDYYAHGENDWQQKFFVNLAQFFCGKDNLEFIDHDSDPIRLEQIVKNFLPFAEAFGCSEDMAMNPRNKCRLY